MTTDLGGRQALVTGGGSGIGRAIAVALASHGALVTVADADADGARRTAAEVEGHAWVVNLAETAQLESLDAAYDIVVNNAGFQSIAPIEAFDPATFRRMHAVMVEAPFLLMRACLPHMYEGGYGRFVNITSVHGLRASAFKSAYVSAKHALEGLSKVVALEGGPRGVSSVCISPGYVRTPLVDKQIADQATAHAMPEDRVLEDVLLARSAVKRLIEPETIADLAVWLCRDGAIMASGSTFTMAGGWTAS